MSRVQDIDFASEMQSAYLDYAMSVIMSRAIPDVRDGLKPVHRRILYAMITSDYHYNKPYRKSARVVGEVLGKYHPHSDAGIYDSIVKMAQSFYMNVVLIDGQGNFGSIDGDKAAASRYTEIRLSKEAHYMIDEYHMDVVDYIPNYDNSTTLPQVLPTKFPNILINGSSGIAVGMATNIPCHNLKEIMQACILLLENKHATLTDIMQFIKGPDFNSDCTLLIDDNLIKGYETGKGSFQIRARHKIEEVDGRESVIFTSIPYQINKTSIIETLLDLMKTKQIDSIHDIRDESDRNGIRLVVIGKKNINIQVMINQIYKYTQLQTTFHMNTLVINGLRPMQMSLKEILSAFIEFRKEIIIRRTKYLLKKYTKRANELKAMYIAVNNIDSIVNLLRESESNIAAKEKLQSKKWNDTILSEEQIQVILDMRLNKLTSLEKNKIQDDLSKTEILVEENQLILNNNNRLIQLMKEEFIYTIEKFGYDRKTEIALNQEQNIEELLEREDMIITMSIRGYIKRVSVSEYKIQNRGGKGKSSMKTHEQDSVCDVFFANTHTPILFFTSKGKVFFLKAYQIPLGSVASKGNFIRNILPLDEDESLSNILLAPEEKNEWQEFFIVFATSSGRVRKNQLTDFISIRSNGKIAMKLENEKLVSVSLCRENDDIVLTSKNGLCNRFSSSELRVFMSRQSHGVKGINLSQNDSLVSMIVANSDEDMLIIGSKGYGKRIPLVNRKHRGIKGQNTMSNDIVVSALIVNEEDTIVILISNGNIIRCKVSDIRGLKNRRGKGVKIVSLNYGETVVSVDKISSSQLI